MSELTRRRLLELIVAGLAGTAAGAVGCAQREPDELLDAALLAWFDPEVVQRAGRDVLARGEGWNDARSLREALLPQLGDAGNPSAARAALAEAVRDDFRADRTLTIDGWIVSETEARLYALAVLQPTPVPQ